MPLAKPKAKVSTLGKGQPEEEEAEEEEEEEEGPRLARRKGKANMSKLLDAAESAMKRDLHDMMDVDDGALLYQAWIVPDICCSRCRCTCIFTKTHSQGRRGGIRT